MHVLKIYAKRLITKSGLSRCEVSKRCGISKVCIDNIFAKSSKLSLTTLEKIIAEFHPTFFDDIHLVDHYKDRISNLEQELSKCRSMLSNTINKRERA